MTYKQFAQVQRYQISALMKMEHRPTETAACLGVDKSCLKLLHQINYYRVRQYSLVLHGVKTKVLKSNTIALNCPHISGPEQTPGGE